MTLLNDTGVTLSSLLSQKEKEIQEKFNVFDRKMKEKEGEVEFNFTIFYYLNRLFLPRLQRDFSHLNCNTEFI